MRVCVYWGKTRRANQRQKTSLYERVDGRKERQRLMISLRIPGVPGWLSQGAFNSRSRGREFEPIRHRDYFKNERKKISKVSLRIPHLEDSTKNEVVEKESQ